MNLTEKNGNHESLTHKNDGRMEIWWCIIGIHLDDVIGICGFINKCLNFSGGWISKYYGKPWGLPELATRVRESQDVDDDDDFDIFLKSYKKH